MKRPICFYAILTSLLFLVVAAFASASPSTVQAETPHQISQRLQTKYDSMESLSFAFKQTSKGQMSGRPRMGGGHAYFYKFAEKSRMRWNYSTPDQQVLISDGETFSMYFAELQQMIVTPAKTLDNDLTYSFFSGQAKIDDKFEVLPPTPQYHNESDKTSNHPKVIQLIPLEPHSQIQNIHLWVTADSLIQRIEIKDHFDTITLLNLSNIEVNTLKEREPEEIASLFSFTPPEGTEIIQQ